MTHPKYYKPLHIKQLYFLMMYHTAFQKTKKKKNYYRAKN